MAAKFFYVKAGLGTRTTGGGLSKQTGSFTALTAANVYAKIADALADSAPPVAGDFICLSSAHALSSATALVYAFPAVFVISVDDAHCENYLFGASESTLTSSSIVFDGGYHKGITYTAGSSSANAGISIGVLTSSIETIVENCKLRLGGTNTNARIFFGKTASANTSRVLLRDTDMKFGATGQAIQMQYGVLLWRGGSIESGSSAIDTLINTADVPCQALLESLDLSNGATAMNSVESTATFTGDILLRNCRMPSSWSGNPGTITAPNGKVRMHNVDAGAVNYRMWEKDYMGEVVQETTIVKSGGASDGVTQLSWKITTSANCDSTMPFVSPEIITRLNSTGSSKTATVEFVHDTNVAGGQGAGTSFAFRNDEFYLQGSYLGSASYPLGTMINDAVANPMATPANQASSSVTWTTTGLTTPVKQSLGVTFTPQMAGVVIGRVVCTAPSKTIYVDPVMTIS